MGPEARQDVSATTPSGRVTRSISSTAAAASEAKMTPNALTAASNAASGSGRLAASPTRKRASAPSRAARSAASATRRSDASTPVASRPRAAAARATLPVPQATLTRLQPGAAPTASSRTSATGASTAAVRS